MSDNNLKHFGIPGMRWGVRRASKSSGSSDHKKSSALKRKKLSDMTNDELKTLTARLQLEKQYKDLTSGNTSAGRKFVSDILLGAGKQVATAYVSKTLTSGLESLLDKKGS